MSLKDINLNGNFGDEIKIDNATQTFQEFKREWAEDWAKDDINDSHAREFIINVVADYYEQDIPNSLKDFREWLVSEKGYAEHDAYEFTEGVEDE